MDPLKKVTVKTVLQDWKDNLVAMGKKAFWPSFLSGQYVRPDNQKTMDRLKRRHQMGTRKKRHVLMVVKGKIVKVKLPDKLHKGDNLTRMQKLENKVFMTNLSPKQYFTEENALNAIARMLLSGGTRKMRRDLCRRLGLRWKAEYVEGEMIIMEQDDFSGPGFDGIKRSRGVKVA